MRLPGTLGNHDGNRGISGVWIGSVLGGSRRGAQAPCGTPLRLGARGRDARWAASMALGLELLGRDLADVVGVRAAVDRVGVVQCICQRFVFSFGAAFAFESHDSFAFADAGFQRVYRHAFAR